MDKVFKLNLPGLNELMKGGEMQGILQTAASAVQSTAAGMSSDPHAEYTSDVVVVNFVALGRVHAGNGAALRENYKNNTLNKALNSVRV